MSSFKLFGKSLKFPEAADRYYEMMLLRHAAIIAAKDDFENYYSSHSDIETILSGYLGIAGKITITRAMDNLFKLLPEIGIYDVTRDRFLEKCHNLDEAIDAFNRIAEKVDTIDANLELEKEYRADRKDSRGRWEGGGFGVGGAIKGAATAGALNAVSGLGHSIFNAIGNLGSNIAASREKRELYENDKTFNDLCLGVSNSIWDCFADFIKFVNEYLSNRGGNDYFLYCFSPEKATALFENAKNLPDKRKELLFEGLSYHPYCADMLAYVFVNYPAERKNISSIANFYQCDLSAHYETIFTDIYYADDRKTEKQLLTIKEKIQKEMNTYGVTSSAIMDQLDTDYLALIYKTEYTTALPGERDTAIAKLRDYQVSKERLAEFVTKHSLWELAKEFSVKFPKETQRSLVYQTYNALKGKDEKMICHTLDQLFIAFGYRGGGKDLFPSDKKEYFQMLCNMQPVKQDAVINIPDRKKKILTEVANRFSNAIVMNKIAEKPYLMHQPHLLQAEGRKLKYIKLDPDEYVFAIYFNTLDRSLLYNTGFVLTDKRFVSNIHKPIELLRENAVSFASYNGYDLDVCTFKIIETHCIKINNLKHIEKFAECLNNIGYELNDQKDALAQATAESNLDIAIKNANAAKNCPAFLVDYFQMDAFLKEVAAEAETATEQLQQKALENRIQTILSSCNNSPESIVKAWKDLVSSELDPKDYENHLHNLYDTLYRKIEGIKSLTSLTHLAEVSQELHSYWNDEQITGFLDAIETKTLYLHKTQIKNLMKNCNQEDAKSIEETWNSLLNGGYPCELYADAVSTLCNSLQSVITSAKSIKAVEAVDLVRKQLLATTNDDRLQQMESIVKEQIALLDQKARTYRNIVFDTVEDITFAKEEAKRLDIIMCSVSKDNLDSINDAIAQVSTSTSKIKEYYLSVLDGYKNDLDTQLRTYKGIVYDTQEQASQANQIYTSAWATMQQLNKRDEVAVKNVYKQFSELQHPVLEAFIKELHTILTDFDIKHRTVAGILFDTLEQANIARQELQSITEAMAAISADNEESMLHAKSVICNCTTSVKNPYLKTVEKMLKDFDIRARTFNGVLYKTREEAALHAEEFRAASEIMARVRPDDEKTILDAQKEILNLKTAIRNEKYTILKKMWEAYDLQQRTYHSIVFETRQQAENARNTHQEFISMFNSYDLTQASNLSALDSYIEFTLQEKIKPEALKMVADVRSVLASVQDIMQQDAKINMTTQKKESAALYKYVEKVLPLMTHYRMPTAQMLAIKEKHHASLNVVDKFFGFFKSKR